MNAGELAPDEAEFLRAYRQAKNSRNDEKLPRVTEEEWDRWAKREGGLVAADTRAKVRATIRRVSNAWPRVQRVKGPRVTPYDGPRVVLDGTVADAQASWRLHFEDLVDVKNASGPVIRRHREAVTHFLRAAGCDWAPVKSKLEQRSIKARSMRSGALELPDDFVALAGSVVNDVQYHKDPSVQAMFQHRARFNFFTGPRTPSEDNRLAVGDVHASRHAVVYRMSKLGVEEREPVLVPREVFDVPDAALTWPKRKSWAHWMQHHRPKLAARAELRYAPEIARHGFAWVHSDGLPCDPDHYRKEFGTLAKKAWPGFYPYLTRELAIIMRALSQVQRDGVLDVELLSQWSGHESYDNLRNYMRRAKALLRSYRPGPELTDLLNQWWNI